MKKINQKQAVDYIARLDEFEASALSGRWAWVPQTGRLTDPVSLAQLDEAQKLGAQIYVVFSYGTPIAWYSYTHDWHLVSQKFSPTTSKHQSVVRRATGFIVGKGVAA